MSSSDSESLLRNQTLEKVNTKSSISKVISKASVLKGRQSVVGTKSHGITDIPPPTVEGSIGSVPIENVRAQTKNAHLPSRKLNKWDTSLDPEFRAISTISEAEIQQYKSEISENRKEFLFPWYKVAEFVTSTGAVVTSNNSRDIKDFILEVFYNDWYFNTATIAGTCFFSWSLAYMGFSWWSLIFIFICTSTVYNFEYTRFNRNIRDDLKRTTVQETLSSKTESTLWLNSFLQKFWVIYMPVLSEQVMDQVNPILKESAPGYGIEGLALEQFTLGSKAPSIRGVRTHTKVGNNRAELEMSFAFTPNDESELTPKEAKEKINPKISLGVTLGKSFVSKTMSVIVENINVSGRVRLMIEFGTVFPNIKIVSVQLLEAPLIDFVLKPVGGDTLGLDVMSFLPGLKTFVKSMINSIIGPMCIAPNKLDIDVEELLAAQSNDAIGMLAVNVTSASNLKSYSVASDSIDPYIVLSTETAVQGASNEVRTSVKSNISNPRWNETKYILLNSLNQKMTLKCFDFNDTHIDTLIGSAEINLSELLQDPIMENVSSNLKLGTYKRGSLEYSLQWYPIVDINSAAFDSENTSSEMETDFEDEIEEEQNSDVGIAKLTLQNIKNLDTTVAIGGNISPSAELFVDSKLVKTYRTIKKSREPAWNETIEIFIPSRSSSVIELKVYHNSSKTKKVLIGSKSSSIDDLLNASIVGNDSVELTPQGNVIFSTQWKTLKVSKDFSVSSVRKSPLGAICIEIKDAIISSDLKGIGDIDPFFTITCNNRLVYKSKYVSDNAHPIFNESYYVPITSKNQLIHIDLYDYQNVGKNRFIGSIQTTAGQILSAIRGLNNSPDSFNFTDYATWALKSEKNRLTGDKINLRFAYVPSKAVFTPDELQYIENLEASLNLKKNNFYEEQAKNKEAMEKNPKDWELVEENDPFEQEENIINAKEKLTLKQLLSSNSGIISVDIMEGNLSQQSCYLQISFDDIVFPSLTSSKAKRGKLTFQSGNAFIRDLKYSKMHFRISKKQVTKDRDDILAEKTFNTIDILKDTYYKPLDLSFGGATLVIKCLFDPASLKLPSCESVINTGYLNLTIKSAEGLASADRNGKSDPYVDVVQNGVTCYTTKTMKKTLSPTWNEQTRIMVPSRKCSEIKLDVFDWDRTGDNDPLGDVNLNVQSMEPTKVYDWTLELSTQGTIEVSAYFTPEYIKPTLEAKQTKLSGMPFKVVSNVAGAGAGVAGVGLGVGMGVAGAGLGGIRSGGKFLKKGIIGERNSIESESRSNFTNAGEANSEEYTPNNTYTTIPRNTSAVQSNTSDDLRNSNHGRTSSTVSSNARTLAPNGIYSGKISVIAAENLGKNVEVKISLTQDGRLKRIFKSKNKKADDQGVVNINETCLFKATPDSNLIFNAVTHHTLAKDKDLGITQLNLSDPQIQSTGNIGVKLNNGLIVVKIDYGDIDEIPPIAEIP